MSSVGPHGSQILKTTTSRIRCLGTASWTASTRGRCGRFRTGLTVIPLYVIGLAQWVTNTTNRQSRTLCICARPPGWQVVAMRPIRRWIDHQRQQVQNCPWQGSKAHRLAPQAQNGVKSYWEIERARGPDAWFGKAVRARAHTDKTSLSWWPHRTCMCKEGLQALHTLGD